MWGVVIDYGHPAFWVNMVSNVSASEEVYGVFFGLVVTFPEHTHLHVAVLYCSGL